MAQFVMSDINLSAFKITAKRKRTRFGNVILHETLNHKSGRFVQQELTAHLTDEARSPQEGGLTRPRQECTLLD
ncbi:unnamed protein product [Arctogadus glacialis]